MNAECKPSGYISMPNCRPFLPSALYAIHKPKPMDGWMDGRTHEMTTIPIGINVGPLRVSHLETSAFLTLCHSFPVTCQQMGKNLKMWLTDLLTDKRTDKRVAGGHYSPFSGSGGATVASGNPRFQNEAICDNTSTTGVMGADSQWSSVSLGIYHDCVNRRHRLEIIIQDFSIAHTFYSHTFGWYFDAWLFWLQPVELPIGWWCHCGHALIWSQNGCQCIWCRQEGAFLFWVLSRRHYFTSPQNGIIPFFSSFTHLTSWWNFPSVLVNPRQAHGVEIVRCQLCLHRKGRSSCTKSIEISNSISQWFVCETTSKLFGFGINLSYQR